MASEVDIDGQQVQGILATAAPIVGTPGVPAAAINITRGLGLAIDIAELEEEAEADV
jgi:DNA-binding IclR family transcriptional regulator